MNAAGLAYRKTAAQGSSGFGLLITLDDTLAGDIRRAAEAERQNDIEARCREVKHALLVIAHLEDHLNRGTEGELTGNLASFYSALRRKLIEAQAQRSAAMLEQQMTAVLDLRKTWQEASLRIESPAWLHQTGGYSNSASCEHDALSWSA
jgi:flagellar biosynthetic protein FliS